MNKHLNLLARPCIGERNGKPIYLNRSWRAFFISLLAGDRTVMMNIRFKDGRILGNPAGMIVANSSMMRPPAEGSGDE